MKRKLILVLTLVCLFSSIADAKLPATYKEFKARYQTEGKTPEGAVKLYFEGVFAYMDKETRKEGAKMLRYSLHYEKPIDQSSHLATFVERMKDPDYNYAFKSFVRGARPENDYRMSPDDFEIRYAGRPMRDPNGYLRIPLKSSGADSPRIIQVKLFDDGLWYVTNNAATYVQVKEPRAEIIRKSHAHDADYDEEEEEEEEKKEEQEQEQEETTEKKPETENQTETPSEPSETEDDEWD